VIITAAAWVADEPTPFFTPSSEGNPAAFEWNILVEACVTDTGGQPVTKLSKSAWKIHVMDAEGIAWLLGFTITDALSFTTPLPGYYRFVLESFPTDPLVAPTACGITLNAKKLDAHGQVVVPVALATPQAVQTLAPPAY
jgi:hypothetical protein